jgi:hypothetical protein
MSKRRPNKIWHPATSKWTSPQNSAYGIPSKSIFLSWPANLPVRIVTRAAKKSESKCDTGLGWFRLNLRSTCHHASLRCRIALSRIRIGMKIWSGGACWIVHRLMGLSVCWGNGKPTFISKRRGQRSSHLIKCRSTWGSPITIESLRKPQIKKPNDSRHTIPATTICLTIKLPAKVR